MFMMLLNEKPSQINLTMELPPNCVLFNVNENTIHSRDKDITLIWADITFLITYWKCYFKVILIRKNVKKIRIHFLWFCTTNTSLGDHLIWKNCTHLSCSIFPLDRNTTLRWLKYNHSGYSKKISHKISKICLPLIPNANISNLKMIFTILQTSHSTYSSISKEG